MSDTAILRLDILDWWHCSAGRGLRSGINTLVIRDSGLPYVPGRTLKGLLRDVMRQAEAFSACHAADGTVLVPLGSTDILLGRAAGASAEDDASGVVEQRFGSQPGLLRVDSAVLPDAWRRWARTTDGVRMLEDLGETLHRTAIDADGQVIPNSLRTLEVMPPMTLDATLVFQGAADPWADQGGWRQIVAAALPLLRSVGTGRTRGLGRLTATLLDDYNLESR